MTPAKIAKQFRLVEDAILDVIAVEAELALGIKELKARFLDLRKALDAEDDASSLLAKKKAAARATRKAIARGMRAAAKPALRLAATETLPIRNWVSRIQQKPLDGLEIRRKQ